MRLTSAVADDAPDHTPSPPVAIEIGLMRAAHAAAVHAAVRAYWHAEDQRATLIRAAALLHAQALQAAAQAAAAPPSPQPPTQGTGSPQGPPGPPQGVSFGSLSSVVACIKGHESGNYSESTHIQDGSGAFQMIPQTWAYYSTLAGYGTTSTVNGRIHYNPTWSYEYLAPPSVQDASLMYALTHGGAGNWSMRYGNDPCTAGLPGGG